MTVARRPKEKTPHVLVTREEWLTLARDILVSKGVGEVKILSLSQMLNVSRSSFYWYFESRRHLLDELLVDWEARNTRGIIEHCGIEAEEISGAVCNFFRCFIDPDLFDRGLDFAVREWSRRDKEVRQRIDAADSARLDAVCKMFRRYGYDAAEADVRARVLYFMQLGYHALNVREPMSERMSRLEGYLLSFTGRPPAPEVLADFKAFALSKAEAQ